MTQAKFQVVGDQLVGHGLSFDASALVGARTSTEDAGKVLVEITEVAFRQGRASALMSWDDRHDLHTAVDALRAIAVLVGPSATGDRHRRSADIIGQLLHDQESGK